MEDAVLAFLGGAGGDRQLMVEWLALMENDLYRGGITVGLGGVYSFLAFLLGEVPVAKQLPQQAKTSLWAIWGAFGIVGGFLAGVFIPGMMTGECIAALSVGGGATHFIHKGAKALQKGGST